MIELECLDITFWFLLLSVMSLESLTSCASYRILGKILGATYEGLTVVPKNDQKYGKLSGAALISDHDRQVIYAIYPNSTYVSFATPYMVGDDIDYIHPGFNFYGVNGGVVLGVAASYFNPYQEKV